MSDSERGEGVGNCEKRFALCGYLGGLAATVEGVELRGEHRRGVYNSFHPLISASFLREDSI